jgi:hypothetical protein
MGVLDFILNLAGLLLWLNWRAIGYAAAAPPASKSLLGTLKRAEPPRRRRWRSLAALAALLLFRTVLYRHVGAAVNWTPHLDLGVIALPFRSDAPGRMLLYSFLSFGLVLGVFHVWLLALSVINRHAPDTDVLQKLVRLQLGGVEHLPWLARLLLAPVVAALLWLAGARLFAWLGLLPLPVSTAHAVQQALVLGLATFPAWKWLLIALLTLHLINDYVYLGASPLWPFVSNTGRRLLTPLQMLRAGRMNFAPLAGIALIWLSADLANLGLTHLYRRLPL